MTHESDDSSEDGTLKTWLSKRRERNSSRVFFFGGRVGGGGLKRQKRVTGGQKGVRLWEAPRA